MERTIRRSTGPTCQLLSGHRGTGKTTELFRLHNHLLTSEPRYFVVYCEVDQYIDLNDVEYTDVLLAIVQQLWKEAEYQGLSLQSSEGEGVLDDLENILRTPIEASGEAHRIDMARLGVNIKLNPNVRHLLRQYLRPRATHFLDVVNRVIERAQAHFQAQGYTGLVVIVDKLDRMFRHWLQNAEQSSHDALFVDTARPLSSVACHVIYTVPPTLLYSPNGAKLAALYDTHPYVLPMIPVTTRSGATYERGVMKLHEIVQRRLSHAGTTSEAAFEAPQIWRRLCMVSGGYLRSLMALVQAATNYLDDLPITAEAIEQVIRDIRDSYVRSIRGPYQWQLLAEVATTKQITTSGDCLQLLESLAVLEYRDSEGPWYDVNPLIRETRAFDTFA
jgi:hypothetical protein